MEPNAAAAVAGGGDWHTNCGLKQRWRCGWAFSGALAIATEAMNILISQPGMPLASRPGMVSLMGEISQRQAQFRGGALFTNAVEMERKLYGPADRRCLRKCGWGNFFPISSGIRKR